MIKQDRFFNFLVLRNADKVVIQQRTEKDIWQHLFQFPLIESTGRLLTVAELNIDGLSVSTPVIESREYKQALTHRNIFGKFFEIQTDKFEIDKDWLVIKKEDLSRYGFPKIIREYLTEKDNYIY